MRRGNGGLCFFIHRSGSSWNTITAGRRGSPDRRGPGKRSLRCIVPCIWLEPIAMRAFVVGFGFAVAVSLGEFGATLMFAGSLRGVTQTAPLAIYDRFATDFPAALALSAVLLAVSAAVLLAVRLAAGPDAVGHARA